MQINKDSSLIGNITSGVIVGITVALVSSLINVWFWSWQLSKTREDKLKDKKIELFRDISYAGSIVMKSIHDVVQFHIEYSKLNHRWADSLKRSLTDNEKFHLLDITEKIFPEVSSNIKKAGIEFSNLFNYSSLANLIYKDSIQMTKLKNFIELYSERNRQLVLNKIMLDYARTHGIRWEEVPFSYTESTYYDTLINSFSHYMQGLEIELYLDNK